jgi:DNA-binding FrmR family transcriptional regulator
MYPQGGDGMQEQAHEHRAEVVDRLSKIEGHIRGIKKMLEEGKSCDLILVQFAAVKSALSNATKLLLEDHFDSCIIANNHDESLDHELKEFRKILEGFLK